MLRFTLFSNSYLLLPFGAANVQNSLVQLWFLHTYLVSLGILGTLLEFHKFSHKWVCSVEEMNQDGKNTNFSSNNELFKMSSDD